MFLESKGWVRLTGFVVTLISQVDPLFDVIPVLMPYKWAITAAGLAINGIGTINAATK